MASILVEILGSSKQFTSELDAAAASAERSSGAFGKMGKAAGLLGLALAGGVAVGLVKSVDAASQFQSSMELIQTQAGASTMEVKNMSKALLGMAKSVGSTPEELSKGLYHVESAGFRGAKALSILKLAAEGAAVGHSDLEQTTTALVAAERTGIKGLGDMGNAMGTLNAIVGAGNMRMDDLTSALGTGVLVSAKAFGLSIQDVGGALATMTSNGIPAVNAASGLKMLFASLAAPTKNAAKLLDSVGLSSSALAETMRTKGLGAALTELKQHMMDTGLNATQTAALLTGAFGKKSSTGLLTLIGNLKDMKKATDQISTGAKTFGKNWEETQKSADFASKEFHASIQALEVEIGSKLLPVVTRFMNFLTSIASAPSISVAIHIAWEGIKGLASDLWTKISDALTGDSTRRAYIGSNLITFRNDGQGLASKFWQWAVTQIGSTPTQHVIVGGDIITFKRDSTLRDRFTQWLKDEISNVNWAVVVKDLAIGLPDKLSEFSRTFSQDLTKAIEKGVQNISLGSSKTALLTVGKLLAGVTIAWAELFIAPLRGVFDVIAPQLLAGGERVIQSFGRGAKTAMRAVAAFFVSIPGMLLAALGDLSTLLYDEGIAIIQGLWDGMKAKWSDVTGWLGGLGGTIKSLKGPIDKDAVLLVEEGHAIIAGLQSGMAAELPKVMALTSKIATDVKNATQNALNAATSSVTSAKASFSNAWSSLASVADSAFSKLHAGILTTTEALIANNTAMATAAGLAGNLATAQSALADAQAGTPQTDAEKTLATLQSAHDAAGLNGALATAQTGLTTAQAGGDAATILAAQQAVADAQYNIQVAALSQQIATESQAAAQKKAISDASAAVDVANNAITDAANQASLDKQAAAERLQLDATNTARQTAFDTALTALQTHLANGHETYKQANKAILKLFKTFIPDYAGAGAELGNALVTSLGQSITSAAKGAGGVGGPRGAGAAIAGGGGDVYNITVNGWVGNDQDLAEKLTNAQIRNGRRTTGGIFGGFG